MQLGKLLMFSKCDTRSDVDIETEVEKLDGLVGCVPNENAFGDSNRAAIRATMNVLIKRSTFDEAVAEYGDRDEYLLCAALDAVEWLCGNGPAPSIDWMALCAA